MTILEVRTAADEQARLNACATEPIRTPGTVQPHGVLLVLNAGTLRLQHVSANSAELLGRSPNELLGLPLHEVVGSGALEMFAEVLDDTAPVANPVPVTINGTMFDAIVHRSGTLILIDLEPVLPQAKSWSTAVLYATIRDLSRIRTADELWAQTARPVRQITGFDRVMVYRFHDDDHGEVMAEQLAEGMESYLGLHYPASDIPAQARELYLRKLSRVIASTTDEPAALFSIADPEVSVGDPVLGVDLGVSELRSALPHHLTFMRNMGQASTMSFSLVHDGRLIGMIICAHRTPRRVPFVVRQGLEILANQVALQLTSIASVEVLTRRMDVRSVRTALIAQIGDGTDIPAALLRGPLTVTDFITADGTTIRLDSVTVSEGDTPTANELTALMDALQSRGMHLPFVTDALTLDHPALGILAASVVGMLAIPVGGDGDYVAWFRNELIHTNHWLGDQTPTNRLTPLSPRTSFSAWSHTVTGTAHPWDGLETEAAGLGLDLDSVLFRRAESRLAHVAMHDALTGLPNRRLLMDRLEHALAKYMRGENLALLFIDLDHFKTVNDTHGHDAGDTVLIRTAERLLAVARAEDTVCRIGGDEFVILCEDTTIDQAGLLAERLLISLRAYNRIGPVAGARVTASIGITSADLSFDSSDLLRQADAAMYRAKTRGGDQHSL